MRASSYPPPLKKSSKIVLFSPTLYCGGEYRILPEFQLGKQKKVFGYNILLFFLTVEEMLSGYSPPIGNLLRHWLVMSYSLAIF